MMDRIDMADPIDTGDEPRSGLDINLWGDDGPTRASLLPPRGVPNNGCPCQVAGRCPEGCDACWRFELEMHTHPIIEDDDGEY